MSFSCYGNNGVGDTGFFFWKNSVYFFFLGDNWIVECIPSFGNDNNADSTINLSDVYLSTSFSFLLQHNTTKGYLCAKLNKTYNEPLTNQIEITSFYIYCSLFIICLFA
jgi:hypothetical protein